MKSWKKKFIPILIILILSIVLALLFTQYKTVQNNSEMLVYKNTKLGFKFAYPPVWKGIKEEVRYGCEDYYNNPPKFKRSPSVVCELVMLTTEDNSYPQTFFSSQSIQYVKNGPPRGGSFLDIGIIDEKYVFDYCNTHKSNKIISCNVYKNFNNITVAKVDRDYTCEDGQEVGCFSGRMTLFIIKSPSIEFPSLVFFTENNEEVIDKVVDSLMFI